MVDVGIVFQKMLMLLVMMSIGFLAGKTRVVSVESNHMLSLLINKITMPCLVVYSSVCNAHSMSNRELLILLGIYFVSFVLMIVVARLFRLLVSPERGHAGIYELLLIFPNSAFIGIPVASAIYGESAVFYLSMYNLPFYVALYCYGVNLIQDTPVRKIDFHQMLSPLMIAFFAISLPVGLGIYWIASSAFGILSQILVDKIIDKEEYKQVLRKKAEYEEKKMLSRSIRSDIDKETGHRIGSADAVSRSSMAGNKIAAQQLRQKEQLEKRESAETNESEEKSE